MSSELPKSPGSIEPAKATEAIESSTEGSPKPFGEYMQEKEPSQATAAPAPGTEAPSPMDLAKGPYQPTATPTMESVHSQMSAVSSSLGDLQQQLNTPNLKLKPSAKYLLRNKLTDVNSKIRDAATKAGVDVGESVDNIGRNNPIMKFLALLSDGTKQLSAAQNHIAQISKGGSSLRPAELLMVQVKLARAQQEIEYSSTILSNAISDIKMLFNTQI
ncbi:MAG: hypothetical protein K9M07_01725 [Simkaniaceae bacterium]|nr:hypothetical protein [Simkaniaceae bacterium]